MGADVPRISNPLRPTKRRSMQVGDLVEWHYHPDHKQKGEVLEVIRGGTWARVFYGGSKGNESLAFIEACRITVVTPGSSPRKPSEPPPMIGPDRRGAAQFDANIKAPWEE